MAKKTAPAQTLDAPGQFVWPPPALPIDQTNATPQLDRHPEDHRAANQAINDIVTVVERLRASHVVPSLTIPSGQVDYSATTIGDWLMINITVPAWARYANITTALHGVYEAGATGSMILRTKIGPQLGFQVSVTGDGTNMRANYAWNDQLLVTALVGTTVSMGIQCARPGGTTIRFDTQCVASYNLVWLP